MAQVRDRYESAASSGRGTGGRMGAGTRSTLIGAMFLMATSAVGPGFIGQTTTFTIELGAAFAFAIVLSIVVDVALQLNVWRVVAVSGRRAQELGNLVLPGLGWLMAALVVTGAVAFNLGNISGAALGAQAMVGLDPTTGALLSAALALALFVSRHAGVALDRVVVVLGVVMIGLTAYVAVHSAPTWPSVQESLRGVERADGVGFLAVTTLIGGTVGGYIVYAGAHRLLDSDVTGTGHVREVTCASVAGVLLTGLTRVLLFLAILGVVLSGAALDPASPTASAFEHAAGEAGLRIFGIVLWAASVSSMIGASYTAVTFVTSRTGTSDRLRTGLVAAFIGVTVAAFLTLGQPPAELLIFAGAFNGLLLPVGVGVILWVAWRRADLLAGYAYPRSLAAVGTLAWLVTVYLAANSVRPVIGLF